jgi:hypothetical protein
LNFLLNECLFKPFYCFVDRWMMNLAVRDFHRRMSPLPKKSDDGVMKGSSDSEFSSGTPFGKRSCLKGQGKLMAVEVGTHGGEQRGAKSLLIETAATTGGEVEAINCR